MFARGGGVWQRGAGPGETRTFYIHTSSSTNRCTTWLLYTACYTGLLTQPDRQVGHMVEKEARLQEEQAELLQAQRALQEEVRACSKET